MTATDVFTLAPHESEQTPRAVRASEAAETPTPPVVLEDFDDDPDKLPYLGWLWRHHRPGDEFYPLAHLVLSGGPGDVWARKTMLIPTFVARDVAEFYATGRHGVTEVHLDLANRAVHAYRACDEKVSEMVARRRRYHGGGPGDTQVNWEVKNAQLAGFADLDTLPSTANANNASASAAEIVPDVHAEVMPTDFRLFKVQCTYQGQERQRTGPNTKICGRPSVAGSMLCVAHGGVPLAFTPDELREIYDAARQRLFAATLMAVDATIDVAANSTNDLARLKAAEIIMDRTGFVPGVEIHLPGQVRQGDGDKTPAQIILERLNQLGVSVPTPHENGAADVDESDVVEAEVVGES